MNRTEKGYKGMVGEVYNGYVDTSITGIGSTLERSEAVDFTQEVFYVEEGLVIKRPLKTDVSFRYFWLGNNLEIVLVRPSVCTCFTVPYILFRIHSNLLDCYISSYKYFHDNIDVNNFHVNLVSY